MELIEATLGKDRDDVKSESPRMSRAKRGSKSRSRRQSVSETHLSELVRRWKVSLFFILFF